MIKFITLLICFQFILPPISLAADSTNASQQFQENSDSGKGSMMNTLMVMSTSALGAAGIIGCIGGVQMAPSKNIFSAGSVIYILGEITAGKDKNNLSKKRAKDLELSAEKMKGTGETQKVALEAALQEQKDMLSFVNKRKMWMMAVNVAWLAAAGVAIAESSNPITIPLFSGTCPQMVALSPGWVIGLYAAWAAFNGMVSGDTLAALLGPVVLTAAVMVVPGMMTPMTRAVLFGASAAISVAVTMELSEKAKVIKGNIEKLENALAQFNEESSADNNNNLAGGDLNTSGAQGGTTAGAAGAISTLPDGNAAVSTSEKICASTGSDGKVSVGSNCSNPVTLSTSNLKVDIPELSSAAQTAVQASNALSSGNAGQAEVAAADLANMAAKVNAANKVALKKLNDQLAKQGKPPVDLDKDTKNMIAQMNGAMSKSVDQGGAPLMAAIGPLSGAKLDPNAAAKKTDIATAVTVAPVVAPTPQNLAEAVSSTAIPDATTPETTVAATAPVAEKTDSLENYEDSSADISNNKEGSLWKQVSNRYLLNYTKFFERKKVLP